MNNNMKILNQQQQQQQQRNERRIVPINEVEVICMHISVWTPHFTIIIDRRSNITGLQYTVRYMAHVLLGFLDWRWFVSLSLSLSRTTHGTTVPWSEEPIRSFDWCLLLLFVVPFSLITFRKKKKNMQKNLYTVFNIFCFHEYI